MVLGCGDRAPNADVTYVLCVKRGKLLKAFSNKIIFQVELASEIIYVVNPLQKKGHELRQKHVLEKGLV